jgi:hypothetical protein
VFDRWRRLNRFDRVVSRRFSAIRRSTTLFEKYSLYHECVGVTT